MKEIIEIQYSDNTFKTGDEVLFSINDGNLSKGKIFVENTKSFFICHNRKAYQGTPSRNRLSQKYSWLVELDDSNEVIHPDEKIIMLHYVENLEEFKILSYPKLTHFINHSFKTLPIFNLKLGIIDMYDSITEAKDEQGFVELHSKERNKKLKIKLGRLLRKIIVKYNEKIEGSKNNKIPLTDEMIEKLHNKWISYNIDIKFEIVTGKDILKGYTKKNYTKDQHFESCMTDKHNFLKLYTENPNQISLMIFYLNHDICGRCIIWKCDDGEKYHDRVYFSHDWLRPAILSTIERNSIKSITSNKSVTLDKISFDWYPFLDSFSYGNTKEKKLTNYRAPGSNRHYRSANGSYSTI